MKISCEEAADICNKAQYKEATFWEVLKLQVHNLHCKLCAKYSRNNARLTKMCKRADLHVLDANSKKQLEAELKKQLDS